MHACSIVIGNGEPGHLLVLYRVKYKFDDDSARSLRGFQGCGGSARRQRLDGILNSCGPRFTCASIVPLFLPIIFVVSIPRKELRRTSTSKQRLVFFLLSAICLLSISDTEMYYFLF